MTRMNKTDYDPNWRHRLYRDLLEPLLGDIGFPVVVLVVVGILVGLIWLVSLLWRSFPIAISFSETLSLI